MRFLDYRIVKMNEKNIQTTTIDEEFKFDLRIGSHCKEKPGNRKKTAEQLGKIPKNREKTYVTIP